MCKMSHGKRRYQSMYIMIIGKKNGLLLPVNSEEVSGKVVDMFKKYST